MIFLRIYEFLRTEMVYFQIILNKYSPIKLIIFKDYFLIILKKKAISKSENFIQYTRYQNIKL